MTRVLGRLPLLLVAVAVAVLSEAGRRKSTFRVAVEAFQVRPHLASATVRTSRLHASTESSSAAASASADEKTKKSDKKKKKRKLGLVTFDLDDTLYPIKPVIEEANNAFARAMSGFGFIGIQPDDIVKTSKQIREEISEDDPIKGATLAHTEIRSLAIRREMEQVILKRKLQATADDWATPVSSLSKIVVSHAKKWAKEAVSPSVVQAVLNAWEMERHHAAERHLYPECRDVLQRIRSEHPDVIIGAVTDGKANPKFMTFTLAPFFDFCLSWEDDQAGRTKFFKELGSAQSNAELKWIYNAALEKYQELSSANAALKRTEKGGGKSEAAEAEDGEDEIDPNMVWIHVGDDLAYDVGGSSACGAKTILVDLDKKYGQTARLRFDPQYADTHPEELAWSFTPKEEIETRKVMNEAATQHVDAKISFLTRLPEAINDILNDGEDFAP